MSAPSEALNIAISESAGDHVSHHWDHKPGWCAGSVTNSLTIEGQRRDFDPELPFW